MITIPTYVEKSKLHNMGLYAARDIEEGEVIWFLDPNCDVIFDKEEFENMIECLSEENKERIKGWAYKRGDVYILCADNSNFWNHSEINPNCGGPSPTYTIALRKIKSGEELLENYKEYDKTSAEIEGELYEQISEGTERETGTEEDGKENGEASN
jgi:hypothetical protein